MNFNLNELGLSKKINYLMVLINVVIFITMSYALISNIRTEHQSSQRILKEIEISQTSSNVHLNKITKEINATYKKNITKATTVLTFLIFLNILGFIIIKKNLAPINTLTKALKEISKGNLKFKINEKISTKDEIGKMIISTEQVANNLATLIEAIRNSANDVVSLSNELSDSATQTKETSNQISVAITSVAEGAGNQVSSINNATTLMDNMLKAILNVEDGAEIQTETLKTTATIAKENDNEMQNLAKSATEELNAIENTIDLVEQMAHAIGQVANEASSVSQNSQETAETAQKGETIVTNTVKGMDKIKAAVLNSAQKIDALGKRSSQIGEIIEVIDDIAEQTNLLALNAAIEAARAGEHGKGFAVVADEVRKLAERSSNATKEIASLIKAIQQDTEEAVQSMVVGTDEVETGSKLANQTKEALKNILDAISGTVDQIQNITASAQEMSASSNTVVKNISDIEIIIQKNTERISHVADNSTHIVNTTQNVITVAQNNQEATMKMKDTYQEINSSVDKIAEISEDTSSLAEEVTASTEEMTATMEATASQTVSLSKMATGLLSEVNKFKV